ncbi:MAG: transcription-repair coupling factor [bacterium]|nr:transcription-repair coupling factor [bacterium]
MARLIPKPLENLQFAEKDIAIQGLKGSYLPFLLAHIVRSGGGPFLIMTASGKEAETILSDLKFFLGAHSKVMVYPEWEVLPYENLSPHPEITSERLSTLYSLVSDPPDIVIATVPAAMQRVMPRDTLGVMVDYVVAGEEIDFDRFIEGLVERGYTRTLHVEEMGEFSVRGGIVDIFAPLMKNPVRIEFFGDEVESIREFDLVTQVSTGNEFEDLVLLPSGEAFFPLEKGKEIARKIKLRSLELGISGSHLNEITGSLKEGIPFQGMEFFLADFYEGTATLFDYLPEDALLVRIDAEELSFKARSFEETFNENYEKAISGGWPFPRPDSLYVSSHDFGLKLDERRSVLAGGVSIGRAEPLKLALESNSDIRSIMGAARKDKSPLEPLAEKIGQWRDEGIDVFLSAHTLGQAERLRDLLRVHSIDLEVKESLPDYSGAQANIPIYVGSLSTGFRDIENRIILIAEEDIFGTRHKRRGTLRKRADLQLKSFSQLKSGDHIVHVDHGIGLYKGLTKLEAGGTSGDYLELEYLGGDKVFLPVDRLNLVQRYAGGEKGSAKLDKLGGATWERVKLKVRKAVADMAEELMEIYAAREVMEGFSYKAQGEELREFEASFEYEETPDQKDAIEEVLSDLRKKRPMDRLICGDVGYGKTEVAIRASFVAAMEGRQVAVLVPTTILAQQHYQTFTDRMKGYPIVVEKLTRFCSAAKQKDVLKRLAEGTVDVVIGTHKLLQKDVKLPKVGLVVIDEEQRFGVAHKEKLKKMRKTVDVLTLTATPIPRTLHMSMMGIRDLSIISSPPEGRLAIKTYVTKFDEEVVREAVLREFRRGGQVFFVHNRVQDIENIAARVKEIVPEAKIAVGHGQMGEKELEQVMIDFDEGRCNLLLCTTIVESGLDIPNANTIIINDAQNMGLSQLYQLRGRVGRSKHRAYAYLMIPAQSILTKEARKRLQAIQEMKELGAGFQLASYDLEIRGAGNIVGAEQSGNIDAVGFELFSSMLEKAVTALKEGVIKEEIEPEITLPCPSFIPEEYVQDTNQRLNLYKRFSSLGDERELDEMKPELLDRFGPVPEMVRNFMELIALKILLKECMIKEAVIGEKSATFLFHEHTGINVDSILSLVKGAPDKYAISPDMRLKVSGISGGWFKVLESSKKILKGLL